MNWQESWDRMEESERRNRDIGECGSERVYQHNVIHCHSCGEQMPLRGNSWLYYMGLVFHDSGSCRALYETIRAAKKGA